MKMTDIRNLYEMVKIMIGLYGKAVKNGLKTFSEAEKELEEPMRRFRLADFPPQYSNEFLMMWTELNRIKWKTMFDATADLDFDEEAWASGN